MIQPILILLTCTSLACAALPVPPAKPPNLEKVNADLLARSALLLDPLTGQILYAKNIDDTFPPASTVKMMTALLTMEKTGGQGSIIIAPEDLKVEPSTVPLRPGENVPISELLRSIIIGSDNDSAMALARTTAGSARNFVAEMNAAALKLGMTHTHFINPNGLPGPGQYTTARDLMVLFNLFLSKPLLRRIAETPLYNLRTAIGVQRMRNHNKLLGVYPGMGPAKTGWTYEARHTFAASATQQGRELRLTLLKSANKWQDTRLLFDYGFANLPPAPAPTLTSTTPTSKTSSLLEEKDNQPVDLVIPAEPVLYIIRRGDSLTTIARRFNVGVEDILLLNPMDNPDLLVPGQTLRVPLKIKSRAASP